MADDKGNGSPKSAVDLLIDLNDRIDDTNSRLDETNAHLVELTEVVRSGFERVEQGRRESDALAAKNTRLLVSVLSSHINETDHQFADNESRLAKLEARVDRLEKKTGTDGD